MKKILALAFAAAMLCMPARSQKPSAPAVVPGPPPVTVKDTEASKALDRIAKEQVGDQKAVNDLFQQARASLDQSQKSLQDEIQKQTKELNDKLSEDKKYKPIVDKIKDLQKQLQDVQAKAQTEFQKNVGTVQQKVQSEMAQVQVLIPIVRKENDLPDNAQYDAQTQKWTVPTKKD